MKKLYDLARRVGLILGVGALLPVVLGAPAEGAPSTGTMRVLNAWADGGSPTVTVDQTSLRSVAFGDATAYEQVPAGNHVVTFRPRNGPATDPIAITVVVETGRVYTVVALGRLGGPAGVVLTDAPTAASTGEAMSRFVNLAGDVAAADLVSSAGIAVAENTAFATASPYRETSAGTYIFNANVSGEGTITSLRDVGLVAGDAYSIVLLGGSDEPVRLVRILDAEGLAVVPQGFVPTGPGEAGSESGGVPWGLVGIAVGVMLCFVGFLARRRCRPFRAIAPLLVLLVACTGPSIERGGQATTTLGPSPTSTAAQPDASTARTGGLVPTHLDLARPGAGGSVVPIDVEGPARGQLQRLDSASKVGWYRRSAVPGEFGVSVLIGHVNLDGVPGVFSDLRRLQAGDRFSVTRSDGTSTTFAVDRVEVYKKEAFPTAIVYAPSPAGLAQARLISCTGAFVKGTYDSNIVVYASRDHTAQASHALDARHVEEVST